MNTEVALDLIAYERAPRHPDSRINQRVVCADGFSVSVQASGRHYAIDSSGKAPYWTDAAPEYPFTSFELGYASEAIPELEEWDSGGVWAWVPREAVTDLLDAHGGVVTWETDERRAEPGMLT